MVGLAVGCASLLTPFNYFCWSKTPLKFTVQELLCWLLNCVFFVYCIIINWSWTFYLDVIKNCLWDVYTLDMKICSPHRIVEGRGKCAVFKFHLSSSIDWMYAIQSSWGIPVYGYLDYFRSGRRNTKNEVHIYQHNHQTNQLILRYIIKKVCLSDTGVQLTENKCLVDKVWWSKIGGNLQTFK